MFTNSAEVLIHRSRAMVFEFVADARNRPAWDDSVDTEELTSPEPIGVGTTVRTRLRSMGRVYQYDWRVTEHRPPSRTTIDSTSGPFPTSLEYELTDEDGGTFVRFTLTGKPSGPMRVLQPLLARRTQQNLDRSFPRLKELLEARS